MSTELGPTRLNLPIVVHQHQLNGEMFDPVSAPSTCLLVIYYFASAAVTVDSRNDCVITRFVE